ncbi:unnamed protein product [Lupinus luteus]|uniref:Uncharacterized protein n=1 Tax=Lupinus luteus TaxID=3873 RepID=A0AAV1VWN9_LUPLU
MTMKSVSPKSTSSSPSPRTMRYLKPGALAKLRDSKVTATNHRYNLRKFTSLSQLLLTPISPSPSMEGEQQDSPNQDNGVPCFTSRVDFNRPRSLTKKKLFAVTPTFTQIVNDQL